MICVSNDVQHRQEGALGRVESKTKDQISVRGSNWRRRRGRLAQRGCTHIDDGILNHVYTKMISIDSRLRT